MIALHECGDNNVLDSFNVRRDDGCMAPTANRRHIVTWSALALIAPLMWGSTYLVTTQLLPPGHPLFSATMRSLPVGLLALLVTRTLPHGSWWWKATLLGTLNMAAFFPLLFVAAQHLPGGVAATFGAAQPVIVALLAVPVLGEALSRWRLLWGVAGVMGVACVVLGPGAGVDFTGVLAGLAGAGSMAIGVTLTKRWGRPAGVSSLAYAGWQLTAGGLVLVIPTMLWDSVPATIDAKAWFGYLWLGLVGTLAAYALWFAGIQRLPVTATALLGLTSPLVAATLGAVLAREFLSPMQLLGFAVCLTAMLAGQLAPGSDGGFRLPFGGAKSPSVTAKPGLGAKSVRELPLGM
jgi:probable blue pigment (indigoidine) exporter